MYIVTGGAGFLGSAMIWRLNTAGIDNILVVDNLASSEKWRNLVSLQYKNYIHRDAFLHLLQSGKAPQGVKAIFHFGACSSTTENDMDFLMANNLHYSQRVCEYALKQDARFINASAAATYGDGSHGFSDDLQTTFSLRPLSAYGYTKHLFDLWACRKNHLKSLVSLKFFNVYGPNEYHKGDMRSVVCKAYKELIHSDSYDLYTSPDPKYAHGTQMRDFVYVKDCVEVLYWLFEHPEVNGVLNMGSGKARTWNDLVTAVFVALGREPSLSYVDMPEKIRDKYQYFTQADMSWLAREACTLPFHSLEEGITDYVHNYLSQPDPYL